GVELIEQAVMRRDRMKERERRLAVPVERRRLRVHDEDERSTRRRLLAAGDGRRGTTRCRWAALLRACGEDQTEDQDQTESPCHVPPPPCAGRRMRAAWRAQAYRVRAGREVATAAGFSRRAMTDSYTFTSSCVTCPQSNSGARRAPASPRPRRSAGSAMRRSSA